MLDDSLLRKVEETIKRFNMLSAGDKVVVGVSGGPDSVVLIHLLYRLKAKYKLDIWAAHLNHCIRGEEAKEEERWVKRFACDLGIPVISECIDVPLLAKKKGIGLEFTARQARYSFLEHIANKVGANKIAMGHTASDQAETVLMRLIRGSGVDGLAGIPPVRGRIIRPLIQTFRWEIEKYCKEHDLSPKQDSSNRDFSFLRNRIRFKLIPYLSSRYNPCMVEVLLHTADLLQIDKDFLEDIAVRARKRVTRKKTGGEVVVNAKRFFQLHLSLQRRIIRNIIQELKGNLEGIEYNHIFQILSLKEASGTKMIDLPDNLKVIKQYNEIIFKKDKDLSPFFSTYLNVPGRTKLPQLNMVFESKILLRPPSRFSRDKNRIYIDLDKIADLHSLFVRPRKEGDRFRPFGMRGEKKLKDFFIDLKVPRYQRDKIPILLSGDKIVWVVGYRMDDRFKVEDATKKVLKIKVITDVTSGRNNKKNKGN